MKKYLQFVAALTDVNTRKILFFSAGSYSSSIVFHKYCSIV